VPKSRDGAGTVSAVDDNDYEDDGETLMNNAGFTGISDSEAIKLWR
jgi:hypothetical protein